MFKDGRLTMRGWAFIESIAALLLAITAATVIEWRAPNVDHSLLHGLIIAALGLYWKQNQVIAQSEKNETILHDQNTQLTKIESISNGGTTQALQSLREEHQRERHAIVQDLNYHKLRNVELEQEIKAMHEKLLLLEAVKKAT